MKGQKTGGRKKGSLNRATVEMKQWIKSVIEANQDQFEEDLRNLEAKDRINVLTSLLKYTVPTLSAVSVESEIEIEYKHLEALLSTAPDSAIEAITAKILTLKTKSTYEKEC